MQKALKQTNRWYGSAKAVWAAILAAPPVGIVLLWMRRGTPAYKKLIYSLPIAVWTVVWLVMFWGLKIKLDGSGSDFLFYFQRHDPVEQLERSRTQQTAQPVTEAPAAAVTPVAASAQVESAPAPRRTEPPAVWTDFRGPRRDGHYTETPILTPWPSKGLTQIWRQPVGGGYASIVVAGGRAFTIEQRRKQEVVAAYDVENGRELWTNAWDALFQEGMGGDGPRATPTWHEGRVYALGATGEFRCLDAGTGKTLWRRNILEENQAENLHWAMSASPLIVDEKVIVLPGGPAGKSVTAYHKVTGEPVWKAQDDKQAYTAPMLATLGGKRQIVVVSGSRAMGLQAEDGALLWDYPWKTEYDINSAQPLILGTNRLFLSAGYGHGAAVIELTPKDKAFAVREVWSNNRMKNKFTSSVLHEGHIYGLDEAILACVNAETGDLKWKGGRYGYGQLLLASGHLVITTESGDVVLVKATPEKHEEISRFSALTGRTWNHPALAGGRLLVRNTTEMACYRIAP